MSCNIVRMRRINCHNRAGVGVHFLSSHSSISCGWLSLLTEVVTVLDVGILNLTTTADCVAVAALI